MVDPIRGLGTAIKEVEDCLVKPYYLVNIKIKSQSHVTKEY